MRSAIAGIVATLIASSAWAEDMNVNVRDVPNDLPPIKCGYQTAMLVGCEGAVASALKKRGELQEKTGALIADGKCAEAMKLSLKQGDYGMAKKVKEMCDALYPAGAPAETSPSQ